MKTLTIIFTNEKVSTHESSQQYKFLCNYDDIQKGDLIVDERYSSKMQVVDIIDNINRKQDNRILDYLYITEINGQKVDQIINLADSHEKNCIELKREEAIKMYNSGIDYLKEIALRAYTEEELTLSLKRILIETNLIQFAVTSTRDSRRRMHAIAKLDIVANYLNKSWKKTSRNMGFFLGKPKIHNDNLAAIHNEIGIYASDAQYAGVVYFQDTKNAVKAIELLGEDIKELFN